MYGVNRENYYLWAKKNGYGVIEENAEMTFKGLDSKKELFGVAYCPCIAPFAHSKDMICPCKPCKQKASQINQCHCGLFKWE